MLGLNQNADKSENANIAKLIPFQPGIAAPH
jgi:hypothetical protein